MYLKTEELLRTYRTVGRHRRFAITDVIKFIKENNINDAAGFSKADANTLNAILFEDYEKLSDIILESALNRDVEDVKNILQTSLFSLGIYKTFDIVLSRALYKLDLLWESGKIGVDEEHIASSKVAESIIDLKDMFKSENKNDVKVLIASLEGFDIIYVGPNTPYTDLVKAMEHEKPKFLVISAEEGGKNYECFSSWRNGICRKGCCKKAYRIWLQANSFGKERFYKQNPS